MVERGARPKAWGVLAVSLALMALVAALSSATGHRALTSSASTPGSGHASARLAPAHRGQQSGRTTASHHATAGATNGAAPRQVPAHGTAASADERTPRDPVAALGLHDPTSQPTTPAGPGLAGPAAVDLASTPALETPASTGGGAAGTAPGSSSPTSAGTSPTGTGGAPRSNDPTHHGTLSFPTTSVTIGAPGGSTVNADATWHGTATMQLTITCPDGVSTSRMGPTGLSLEVDDTTGGPGPCSVRLGTPPGVDADVAFTLTVEPAG